MYDALLKLLPHKAFTFSKIWLMTAHFEIRQMNIDAARKVLGRGIGMCPRNKLFKGYIQLELQLGNVDRCRKLYEKYLEFAPHNCVAWSKYAQLEALVGESERCRGIYELAIGQPLLDMPEMLWKAYIDFEIAQEQVENTRRLYERLLERTQHVKVFISFAQFESSSNNGEHCCFLCQIFIFIFDILPPLSHIIDNDAARGIFDRAYSHMKRNGLKEERKMLLDSWVDFEKSLGMDIFLFDYYCMHFSDSL